MSQFLAYLLMLIPLISISMTREGLRQRHGNQDNDSKFKKCLKVAYEHYTSDPYGFIGATFAAASAALYFGKPPLVNSCGLARAPHLIAEHKEYLQCLAKVCLVPAAYCCCVSGEILYKKCADICKNNQGIYDV
jgi:hypothetical protein